MKLPLAFLFLLTLIGCSTGAPPSAFERSLYTVQTNYVTNVVALAQIDPTNPTNKVVTNVVYQTNVFATYELTPKEAVVTGIQTGGTLGTMLGFGPSGVIASLLLGALSAFGAWRSNRRGKALTILGQNIETASEIFKAQPGGAALDAKFKTEIKSQQVEGGVKKMAADVHDNQVNPGAAKESAERVMKPGIPSLSLP